MLSVANMYGGPAAGQGLVKAFPVCVSLFSFDHDTAFLKDKGFVLGQK